ncbi:Putative AAA+ ATPase domain, ABC transporter, P-loop containing nucleoside triphosphate hydrolase [Septoria linicola]|uniref:AAA+ ATPase domain, ABC transporter, P-loop containing nucleoside triphosphate hydrolase n=1 Tax=Septoria linicola TaxID=215465 RepID=A0A9Q9AIG9_9PEZI|nr:Putative AAA+ ATPase domain, ABC transporter, P-loop containing nucleoside triphosphate hydrolase [Septoria linicola]
MQSEIRSQLPDIDSVVVDYAAGYLNHAARQFSAETDPLAEAAAVISQLLLSASGDLSEENEASVQNLVQRFVSRLNTQNGVDGERRQQAPSARRLDQTIQVASQRGVSSTLGLTGATVDLESANTRKVESRVDKKKLEKAERKLRAKQDRKVFKTVEYEASRLLDQPDEQQSYEEFFMAVNPLQLGSDAASKSKDIKVDGIDISIGGKRIMSDTNLTLAYGRRYGLVGQNGIGKSTLLRALSKREVAIPTHISILHVEQEITGDDTPALQAVLDADVWRKHLLKEQEKITKELAELEAERSSMADTSTDAARLDKQREGLDITLSDVQGKLAEMESDKAEPRAASILAGLGFSHERQQFATKTFSGGWRMRLALARALFCEPDLLLLDEPSNMLDVPSITFLSNYLQGYPSTVLVVSHDRAFLNEVATDIIHQHSERLDYYKGANFDSFYATKEERRKTAQREYEKQMGERAHLQAFIDKFRYNAAKSSEAQSRIKKLERMPILEAPESVYTVHFKFPEVEKLSPPIIQMTNVTFGYSPDKILLRNVDLDVQLDSRIGIVGPNGAGKTTALKLLIGALSPSSGLISQNPRLRIGFFAQHHVDALDLNASAVGFMAAKYPGKSDEEYRRHLGAFGITGMTGLQKMGLLSGGQKSRVAFACIGLQNPHILVLDEPSNHLDIEAMDALSTALNQFQGGVLMVSHDVTMLQNVCTSLWVCDNGTVEHFDGTVKDYKKRITAQAGESGVVAQH